MRRATSGDPRMPERSAATDRRATFRVVMGADISLIQAPGDANRAGVIFGLNTRKTTGLVGRKDAVRHSGERRPPAVRAGERLQLDGIRRVLSNT
jgi:hypothetical protein